MVESQSDVDALHSMSKEFELVSLARINWSKGEAVLVGLWVGKVLETL